MVEYLKQFEKNMNLRCSAEITVEKQIHLIIYDKNGDEANRSEMFFRTEKDFLDFLTPYILP